MDFVKNVIIVIGCRKTYISKVQNVERGEALTI